MRKNVLGFALLIIALSSTGFSCTTEVDPAAAEGVAPEETAATALHAGADVKPGSHEDWCAEHSVPESLCTRCNPALVAAFKATGDWCAEHGLPESQCLICNPDLTIERPPKSDGAP